MNRVRKPLVINETSENGSWAVSRSFLEQETIHEPARPGDNQIMRPHDLIVAVGSGFQGVNRSSRWPGCVHWIGASVCGPTRIAGAFVYRIEATAGDLLSEFAARRRFKGYE